jgi:hypothetical protein
MKRIILLIVVAAMALPLVGCGSDTVQAEPVPAGEVPKKGGGAGGAAVPTKGLTE